jgi:hypothetical protein
MRSKVIYYSADRYPSQFDLNNIRHFMSKEDLEEMKNCTDAALKDLKFLGYENRLLAEKMFELGYLAAHVEKFYEK